MSQKILYTDLDNMIVDYPTGKKTKQQTKEFGGEYLDDSS